MLSTDGRQRRTPARVRPHFPFSYPLSNYLLGDCLISGQAVIPRNYGVFSVHKDIVPNVFLSSIYNHFLLLNSRLIWILTTCQFQHTSPTNISFLGREEAQTMWSCVVLFLFYDWCRASDYFQVFQIFSWPACYFPPLSSFGNECDHEVQSYKGCVHHFPLMSVSLFNHKFTVFIHVNSLRYSHSICVDCLNFDLL